MNESELHDFWLFARKMNPTITRAQSDALALRLHRSKLQRERRGVAQ